MQGKKQENGIACRVGHNAFEKRLGSSSLVAVPLSVTVVVEQFLRMDSIAAVGELVETNDAAAAVSNFVGAVASAEPVSRAAEIVVTLLSKGMNSAKEEYAA
jgi:hypothetical protein